MYKRVKCTSSQGCTIGPLFKNPRSGSKSRISCFPTGCMPPYEFGKCWLNVRECVFVAMFICICGGVKPQTARRRKTTVTTAWKCQVMWRVALLKVVCGKGQHAKWTAYSQPNRKISTHIYDSLWHIISCHALWNYPLCHFVSCETIDSRGIYLVL